MNEKIHNKILRATDAYNLLGEYIDYLTEFENECAWTDSIIARALGIVSEIETEITNELNDLNTDIGIRLYKED